jgi:hypothetical protein
MIQTTEEASKPKSNREKIADMRKHHENIFNALGIPTAKFIPKMAYKHNGELVISFFDSEMNLQQDIYTEFSSRDYNPEDPERNLYKWKWNPHYKEEYETTDPSVGYVRYLVPVTELIKIKAPEDTQRVQLERELTLTTEDASLSQMTIKDLYAIMQNKPVSDRVWLNNLIKNNQK